MLWVVAFLLISSAEAAASTMCVPSGDWKRVLRLTREGVAENRSALEQIAKESTDADAGQLARFVLENTKPGAVAFRAAKPTLLRQFRLSEEELQAALRGHISARTVMAEVSVGADGCALRVRVLGGASEAALRDLIERRLKATRFIPAKPRTGYVKETSCLSIGIEAR